MSDDPLSRPKSHTQFSNAAGGRCYDWHLGAFTKIQLDQLQEFLVELNDGAHRIPCTLTLEQGHISCSAIFTLTSPEGSPEKNIQVTLAEAREGAFGYSYTMYTRVDDVPRGTLTLTRCTQTREIPEFALRSLREKILELNAHDFDEAQSIVRDPKVTQLGGWHRRAF